MTCGTVGASADNGILLIKEESTYDTVPSGNPKFEQLGIVSESLGQDTGTTSSAEITGDRQVSDITRSSVSASGDIAWELQYQSAAVGTSEAHDLVWEAAFQSAGWATQVQVSAATISCESIATSGSGFATLNDSGAGLAGFTQYEIIKVKGFTGDTSNNAFCQIVSVAAGELEVIVLNTAGDFVDDAAGETVTITQGPYIENGSTCRSFTAERQFTDLTNVFSTITGIVFSGFGMTVPTEGNVTGVWNTSGARDVVPSPTATAGDGSPNTAEPNDKIGSVDGVLIFTENNAKFDIVNFSFQANNNVRPRRQVGSAFAVSQGSGQLQVTGTLQAFFADRTFFDKYLAFTETRFSTVFQDTAGNAYVLMFPAVRLTSGRDNLTGINTDVVNDMGWSARKSPTEGVTVRLARFDSADVA